MIKKIQNQNGSIGGPLWIMGTALILFLIVYNVSLNSSLASGLRNEIQNKLNNAVSNTLAKNIDIEAFRDGSISTDSESGVSTGVIIKSFQEEFEKELQILSVNSSYDRIIVIYDYEKGDDGSYGYVHQDSLNSYVDSDDINKIQDAKHLYIFVTHLSSGLKLSDDFHFEEGKSPKSYYYLRADIIMSPQPYFYSEKDALEAKDAAEINELTYQLNTGLPTGRGIDFDDDIDMKFFTSSSRVYRIN